MTFFIYLYPMIIELLCRFNRDINESELKDLTQELEIEALIKGNDFDLQKEKDKILENNKLFDYSPMVINLKDVFTFNLVDDLHTCIRFYNNISFTFKIEYNNFRTVYQTITGRLITDLITELNAEDKIENGK
jgi:hypothetical protein